MDIINAKTQNDEKAIETGRDREPWNHKNDFISNQKATAMERINSLS